MGDIVQLFRSTAFDPETVEVLCCAYDLAVKGLHDTGQPSLVKEIIARRVIEEAEKGERDPHALAAGALSALGLDVF